MSLWMSDSLRRFLYGRISEIFLTGKGAIFTIQIIWTYAELK